MWFYCLNWSSWVSSRDCSNCHFPTRISDPADCWFYFLLYFQVSMPKLLKEAACHDLRGTGCPGFFTIPQDLNLDLRNEHCRPNPMSHILKLTTNMLGCSCTYMSTSSESNKERHQREGKVPWLPYAHLCLVWSHTMSQSCLFQPTLPVSYCIQCPTHTP